MDIPSKKLQSNFELPVIGLGTAMLGGGRQPDYSADKSSIELIKKALDLGYSHIDTAEMYGGGHTEELVGLAIRDFNRDGLTISTKISDINLGYEQVLSSAEQGIKRLGVEYVDLLYIHAPSVYVSLSETMKAMDKLVDEGLVRHIGVSNFPVELLQVAQTLTEHKIVANQIEYNLMTREIGSYGSQYGKNVHMESKILPYCQENDIFVVACRPLGMGSVLKKSKLLKQISEQYQKTYAEIALSWLISQENVVAIAMSRNIDHLRENINASNWQMPSEDIEKLRKEFPTKKQPENFIQRFFK
jgi:diketogulonate reductase-like aldo/keto reductase